MIKLFSYCIPIDNGSAPNPFHGVCTLAICKPKIRSTAKIGDWIVGTGSKEFNLEGKVVYAMKVTQRMTFQDYDSYCRTELQGKIPNWRTSNFVDKIGDCIYDYSTGKSLIIRKGVHNEKNMITDLNGKYVLLSNQFYYFGDRAKYHELPESLLPIVHQYPSHKSDCNEPYVKNFIKWICKFKKNNLYGEPFYKDKFVTDEEAMKNCSLCSSVRKHDAEKDYAN